MFYDSSWYSCYFSNFNRFNNVKLCEVYCAPMSLVRFKASSAIARKVPSPARNLPSPMSKPTCNIRQPLALTVPIASLRFPAGNYKLTVTATGFRTFTESDIVVKVNDQLQIDATLDVGSAQQEVINVEANAVQVQTESTQLGDVIDSKKMLALTAQRPQLHRSSGPAGGRRARHCRHDRRRPSGLGQFECRATSPSTASGKPPTHSS